MLFAVSLHLPVTSPDAVTIGTNKITLSNFGLNLRAIMMGGEHIGYRCDFNFAWTMVEIHAARLK